MPSFSKEEEWIRHRLMNAVIPHNFAATLPFYNPLETKSRHDSAAASQPRMIASSHFLFDPSLIFYISEFHINPQTTAFLQLLELPDLFSRSFSRVAEATAAAGTMRSSFDPNEIAIDQQAATAATAIYSSCNPDEIELP